MNRQKAILATLTILLYACLAGCSRSPVDVEQAVPEEMAFASETLDIRNCDSNDDMRTTLADQAPVKQQVSIAEQATVVETGSAIDISPEILDELRLQVESAYQPLFEEAVTSAEKVEFTIPGHMIHMYKIHWIRRIYRSTISFSINDQSCAASYVYTLESPDLDSHTVMACTA